MTGDQDLWADYRRGTKKNNNITHCSNTIWYIPRFAQDVKKKKKNVTIYFGFFFFHDEYHETV